MDCLNEGLDVIVVLNSLKTIDFPDDHVLSDESGGYLISYRNNEEAKEDSKGSNDNDISFKIDVPDIEVHVPDIQIMPLVEESPKRSPKKPAKLQILKNTEYEQGGAQKKSWNLDVKMNDPYFNEPTPTFNIDINDVLTWDNIPSTESVLKEEKEGKTSDIAGFNDISNIEKYSLPSGIGTYEELSSVSRVQNNMDLSFSYCTEEVVKPIVGHADTSFLLTENKQDVSILPAHNETIILLPDPPPLKSFSRARASIQLPTKTKQASKSQVKLRQKSQKSVLIPQNKPKSPKRINSLSSKPQKSLKKPGHRSQSKQFTSFKDFSSAFNFSSSTKHLTPLKLTNHKVSFTGNHLTFTNPYMQELRKFSQKPFFPSKNQEDSLIIPKKPKKKRIIFF